MVDHPDLEEETPWPLVTIQQAAQRLRARGWIDFPGFPERAYVSSDHTTLEEWAAAVDDLIKELS